jgi:hypothetical protein
VTWVDWSSQLTPVLEFVAVYQMRRPPQWISWACVLIPVLGQWNESGRCVDTDALRKLLPGGYMRTTVVAAFPVAFVVEHLSKCQNTQLPKTSNEVDPSKRLAYILRTMILVLLELEAGPVAYATLPVIYGVCLLYMQKDPTLRAPLSIRGTDMVAAAVAAVGFGAVGLFATGYDTLAKGLAYVAVTFTFLSTITIWFRTSVGRHFHVPATCTCVFFITVLTNATGHYEGIGASLAKIVALRTVLYSAYFGGIYLVETYASRPSLAA